MSGSSSSHSGAPDAATRASVARFAWPEDSSRTGTCGEAGEAERGHRRIEVGGPAPETQARAQAAARGRARDASSASASGERSTRPRSALSSPAARRIRLDLPLPLGPATCSASPGPSSRSSPSNSKPAAAPQRDVLEAQQRAHSTLSSSACMSSSEKPKWWPTSWITICATICSRLTLVARHSSRIGRLYKRDALGQHARLVDALVVERNAFVKAAQVASGARGPARARCRRRRPARPAARCRRGFPRTARAGARACAGRSRRCPRRTAFGADSRSAGVMAPALGAARPSGNLARSRASPP